MDLFWVFGSVAIFGMIVYAAQILAVHLTLRSPKNPCPKPMPSNFPPISILKPLKGLEDNLFDNLESFCLQDYPEYEIICSLQDPNDPAYRWPGRLKRNSRRRTFRSWLRRCNGGLNPKVNNLLPAYGHAKYPTVLISDSNVMVDRHYLKTIITPMGDPEVGLVNNLIRGVGGKTIGSLFENLHLNSFILGNICLLNRFLNIPCVVGKSMLMRKGDLEAIGGLTSFKDVLAEDHFIGEKMRKRGKRVIVSDYLINNVNEYWGLRKFINRHIRWGKMRWKILGIKYFAELMTNPVFISFLPLLFCEWTARTLSLPILVSLFKGMGDYYLGKKIQVHVKPFAYVLSPVKDLLVALIWFACLGSDTVVWRGNRYLIGKNTLLSPCAEKGIWAWRYRVMDAIKARMA